MRYGVDALPHGCVVYVKKKRARSVLGGARRQISPTSHLRASWLRNSGAPAVVLRSFQLRVIERGHAAGIAGKRRWRLCRGTADTLPRLALAHNRHLYLPALLRGLKCSGYIYTPFAALCHARPALYLSKRSPVTSAAMQSSIRSFGLAYKKQKASPRGKNSSFTET
jgi:hypothetical protein